MAVGYQRVDISLAVRNRAWVIAKHVVFHTSQTLDEELLDSVPVHGRKERERRERGREGEERKREGQIKEI